MQLPKIKISLHNAPPDEKCVYFKLNNYFSELKTEIDKARARYNLGIADEYSLTWEAIVGKPDILSLLDTLKLLIIATYNLGNLSGSLQEIRARILELETRTLGIDSDTITDVNKLWSDVARNSRDILALQSGGDTSLVTRVAKLENDIANIASNTQILLLQNQVNGLDSNLLNILSRVTTLEQNSGVDLSTITATITLLQSDVNYLKSQITADEITGIRLSLTSPISVTLLQETQPIRIYAIHSRISEQEITNLMDSSLVISTNSNVAHWDEERKIIILNSEGTATLTFSYATFELSLVINVTENGNQLTETTYYIGYAPASALLNGNVVGNNQFAVKNSNGTINISGLELNKYSGCDIGNGLLASGTCLIFCLPQGKSLLSWFEIFNNESELVYYLNYSNGIILGDIKYNVYYITPASYNGLSYKFVIS